jgi:hypothetical protein
MMQHQNSVRIVALQALLIMAVVISLAIDSINGLITFLD